MPNISKMPDISKTPNMSKMLNVSKTVSKHRDINMATKLGIVSVARELLRIKDGLSKLKLTNFKCKLLNYDNVKNWKL